MLDTNGWACPKIKMIQQVGTIKISNNGSLFNAAANLTVNSLILTVTPPTGNALPPYKSTIVSKLTGDYIQDEEFNVILNQSGEYKLEFVLKWREGKSTGNVWLPDEKHTVTATTYIYVNPEYSQELKPYMLGGTIRRLLDLTPTRTINEPPKYTFDPVQLAEYDKEESPEFAFTGHTLFEALLLIAQYKGAFPVLKDGVISFRKLWSGERREESKLPIPIDEISCSDMNQYCTYLESEVQNLVGINDSQAGSIVEPYAGGYKTTRAASGSEISQDTVVIPTDYNQYLHIKEEIGYIGDDLPDNGDLTPYIYESGDYYALSDTTSAYPDSKAYALQWEQMGKNITELTHRIQSLDKIPQAFTESALANIIKARSGIQYDTGFVKYIKDLINPSGNSSPSFADLMFRTTYIPVINSRIKQYKDYFGDFHHDGSIKYNQTAELVDSEMYGEHVKQLIRKIGNATKRKIYIFDKIDDVPKVGTLVGDYSVYDVQMSIRENKVIATISYVKYAELSQYIGVKNPWKDSDVSVDKCYQRQISCNEFVLFTRDNEKNSTAEMITVAPLLPSTEYTAPLTCVEATGYMADGEKLNTVLLPVVSLAIGNSIMFQWAYQNNYSAGYMSEKAPDGAKSLISGTKYNRAQKAVKYCDMYGKLETYNFSIMRTGPVPDGKNMIWIEGFTDRDDLETDVQVTNYPGTVNLTSTRTKRIYMSITEVYPVDITVEFSVTTTTGTIICTEIIFAGTVNKTSTKSFSNIESYELISATCFDISDKTCYISAADVSRRIGYSLPLKPTELRKPSDLSQWQGEIYLTVENLLVEKNSSEALTFSVQLHYCADDKNFIVGSGMTNFCPLIGAQAKELALYGFDERINIYNRRLSVSNATRLSNIGYLFNPDKRRIEITLPIEINNYQAWAYMGKDKHENWQIIFGENRDLKGSGFETELYLLPMHKLEDFI